MQAISLGEYRSDRTRDCSVRALANCTLLEYEDAEEQLSYFGRATNKGAYPYQIVPAYYHVGLNNLTVFGFSEKSKEFMKEAKNRGIKATHVKKGMTLKTFLKNNPKGRFAVLYSKHIVAVVDGQLIDTIDNNPNVRLIAVFKQ